MYIFGKLNISTKRDDCQMSGKPINGAGEGLCGSLQFQRLSVLQRVITSQHRAQHIEGNSGHDFGSYATCFAFIIYKIGNIIFLKQSKELRFKEIKDRIQGQHNSYMVTWLLNPDSLTPEP